MATYVYDDFRVTLGRRGTDGGYAVVAVDPTGNTQTGTFRIPFAAGELEQAVLGLARGVTRKATPVPRSVPIAPAVPEDTDSTPPAGTPTTVRDVGDSDEHEGQPPGAVEGEVLGALLCDALLAGELGASYEAARRKARQQQRGLRLTLSLGDAPELLSIPWELLYQRPNFVANQRRTPLVRHLVTDALPSPPCIDHTVRILGVVANRGGLAPLDVAAERERMDQALAAMKELGRVEMDWLEPATPRTLRERLRDGNYHVLHYSGHGDFNAAGEGVLFLDGGTGTAVELDSTELANLLADQSNLRLVVLNSCEGARTTVTDPFAGVATTLIHLDVPAVVAMQFSISDAAAILFAEELYTNLIGRQDPIDAAVAEARKAIYIEMGTMEWATPVLFMADPSVQLFQFALPAAPLPPPPPPDATTSGVLPLTSSSPARARTPRRRTIAIAAAVAAVVAAVAVGAVVWWPSEPAPPVADWDGARFDLGAMAEVGTLDDRPTISLDRLSITVDGQLHDADNFEEEPLQYWWTTSPFTNQANRLRQFVLAPDVEVLALDHVGDEAACVGDGTSPSPSWVRLDAAALNDPVWRGTVAILTYSDTGLVERIRFTHGCAA